MMSAQQNNSAVYINDELSVDNLFSKHTWDIEAPVESSKNGIAL